MENVTSDYLFSMIILSFVNIIIQVDNYGFLEYSEFLFPQQIQFALVQSAQAVQNRKYYWIKVWRLCGILATFL